MGETNRHFLMQQADMSSMTPGASKNILQAKVLSVEAAQAAELFQATVGAAYVQ